MAVPPSERNYRPRTYYGYEPPAGTKEKLERFAELNRYVTAAGGWVVSPPGSEIRLEVLPGSTLPADLRKQGYKVEPDGEGERIIPNAITEAVITQGSSKTVFVTTHAGIVSVERYRFKL